MIGFVYVLRCGDYVKIGWSRNPKARLAVAKNFNPHPVSLLTYFSGKEQDEKAAHSRFSRYRVSAGEWFHFTPEIREWVAGATTSKDDVLIEWLNRNRGSKVRLSRYLGLSPGGITQWRRCPVAHLAEVEKFTGIDRRTLRPDIFEGQTPEQFRESRAAASLQSPHPQPAETA